MARPETSAGTGQRGADGFAELFDAHAAAVLRYFQLRTASGEVAADLCAETFATALESVQGFDPSRGSPSQWLWGIARHQWARWVRTERIERTARQRLGVVAPNGTVDDVDLVELRVDLADLAGPLRTAVAALSPALRDAVMLRVLDELPYDEVAGRLGCSAAAARVRVSRGLAALLDGLEARREAGR